MKRIITITLLSIISVGLFANGTSEEITRSVRTNHSRIEFEKIGEKQVEPNAAIIATFTGNDNYPVAEEYLKGDVDLRLVPKAALNNIDLVLGVFTDSDLDETDDDDADQLEDTADEAEDLKELIREQLISNLVKGEIEYTYMILGRNIYSSSYDF